MEVEIYQNEVLSISKTLTDNIQTFKSDQAQKDQLLKDIESQFIQLNEAIRQLDVESRNYDPETKKSYQVKVAEHRKTATELQNDYQRAKGRLQRNDLLAGKSGVDQDRYLNVNEKLSRQQKAIQNATRSVAETEEVGVTILQDLDGNRNKILDAHAKVSTLNNEVGRADEILTSMEKRDRCIVM